MTKTDEKTITIEQAENLAIAYRSYNEAKRRGLKGDLDIWRKMLWNAQYKTRVYLEPMSLLECGDNVEKDVCYDIRQGQLRPWL